MRPEGRRAGACARDRRRRRSRRRPRSRRVRGARGRALPRRAGRARSPTRRAHALAEGTLDAALFFSPRTAEIFAVLVRAAGLAEATAPVAAVACPQPSADALGAAPVARGRGGRPARPRTRCSPRSMPIFPPQRIRPWTTTRRRPTDPARRRRRASRAPIAIAVARPDRRAGGRSGRNLAVVGAGGRARRRAAPRAIDSARSDSPRSNRSWRRCSPGAAKRQDEIGARPTPTPRRSTRCRRSSPRSTTGSASSPSRPAAPPSSAGSSTRSASVSTRSNPGSATFPARATGWPRLADTAKALQARVAALEKAQKAAAREGAGLVVAAASLAEAVRTGQPYATPLATVAALAKNDMDMQHQVATLLPHARQGVPTLRDARRALPQGGRRGDARRDRPARGELDRPPARAPVGAGHHPAHRRSCHRATRRRPSSRAPRLTCMPATCPARSTR